MNSLSRSFWTKCYPRPPTHLAYFHSSSASSLAKVVATRRLLPISQKRLEQQTQWDLVQWQEDRTIPREKLLRDIKGAEALLCMLSDNIDKEILEAAGPQLKIVTTLSVGVDHIDLKTAKASNIKIGYTPDVLTDATADTGVLLALAAARNVKKGIDDVKTGGWQDWRPAWLCGHQFTSKTLGVVGLGRIGQAVAHRLGAFGIDRLVYWGRSKKEGVKGERVPMDQLLMESDIVVVCCPLTPETQEMFDYAAFRKMKKNAVFVNISRGGIVNQADLARALKEKVIAGAGLDVTTPEPLPLDDPLQHLDNCVVLPHLGTATFETREMMGDMMIDNILAALENRPIPYQLK